MKRRQAIRFFFINCQTLRFLSGLCHLHHNLLKRSSSVLPLGADRDVKAIAKWRTVDTDGLRIVVIKFNIGLWNRHVVHFYDSFTASERKKRCQLGGKS